MDIENDGALVGIGKRHRVMLWDGQQERENELHWGLPSRAPDIFQIPLLKSETSIIDRPCLLLDNAFGLVKRAKTIYTASVITGRHWTFSGASPRVASTSSRRSSRISVICLRWNEGAAPCAIL